MISLVNKTLRATDTLTQDEARTILVTAALYGHMAEEPPVLARSHSVDVLWLFRCARCRLLIYSKESANAEVRTIFEKCVPR